MSEPDAYDAIEQKLKKQEKKDRKLQRKLKREEKRNQKQVKFAEDIEKAIDEGVVVCDDDIDKEKQMHKEEEYLLKKPVMIESGLLGIDEFGDLYCMDVKIPTDQSHKVNRQVVMQMCKEIYKKVETGTGFRYIPLINNYNINLQQLNQLQNRNKNKYVNAVRKFILGGDKFKEEEDYFALTMAVNSIIWRGRIRKARSN